MAMKIAIIAASGNVGSHLINEALDRGHLVTSVSHNASKQPRDLMTAVRRSGVKRYLVVGGPGSLQSPEGSLYLDSPHHCPAPYRDEALGGKAFLDALEEVDDLNWTRLSPSALFIAGERTGKFPLGDDTLLVGADGQSWISYEDDCAPR